VTGRFIKFPLKTQEIHEKEAAFYRIPSVPGVVSVIDCTHVKIIAPKENEVDYVNIKQQPQHEHTANV